MNRLLIAVAVLFTTIIAVPRVGQAQTFKVEKFDIKGEGGTDYVAVEAATGRVSERSTIHRFAKWWAWQRTCAQYGLGLPSTPQIYMPHAQFGARFMTLLARTSGDAGSLGPAVRGAVLAADAEQPVYNVTPLEDMVSNSIATRRLGLWLVGVFAFGALALASIGIYGVVSYWVTQRASEFGIRMALGATPGDILRQAVGSTIRMVALGLIGGLAGSFAVSKLMEGFLFGIGSRDALTFALLALFLASVALAASYVPARRAAAVDPATALKHE